MAGILGAHLKVEGGRYMAGFAWIDGGVPRPEPSLAAPVESDRGLSELYQRALELVRRRPDIVALLKNEALRAPASFRIATRAEGVLIAAAQSLHVPVAEWSGSALYKPAGLTKAKGVTVKMAITRLLTDGGLKPEDAAQGLAVAVAVAEAKKRGVL